MLMEAFFISNFNFSSQFFPAFLRTDILSRFAVKKISDYLINLINVKDFVYYILQLFYWPLIQENIYYIKQKI